MMPTDTSATGRADRSVDGESAAMAAGPRLRGPLARFLSSRGLSTVLVRCAEAFLILMVLAALLAPLVIPISPSRVDFSAIWSNPNPAHWLGTDQLGRDLLARAVHGARASLFGPVLILAIASLIGVAIGVCAAWCGGWVDALLARITDVMFAFPGLLFVVLVVAVFGSSPMTAIIALGFAYAPIIAKYSRSLALQEIARPYVDSYRTLGLGGARIAITSIVPNIAPALLGYLVVLFGETLMSLATLSYLGFGAQPPSSEWGLMVQEGQDAIIQGHFLPAFVPGIAIALVVVAVNIVGVRLADRLVVRK
ncbi:MAG: ABC transporter permease [Brevibacterium aurantiacum]|uniref:ABC transporter permease n=1 Tax=Brevibacterium aurantiacum TaxID=273384 RepID=UPI001D01B0FE|nr:ABC transporter permease [Brevibacterium aurantiacum]